MDIDLLAHWRIRRLRGELELQSKARRIAAQGQDEEISSLREECDELRLLLTALLDVLVLKGAISADDISSMLSKLRPPELSTDDANPFAGLGS
jgi:hypothetical protein